jgi:hypothetical protein
VSSVKSVRNHLPAKRSNLLSFFSLNTSPCLCVSVVQSLQAKRSNYSWPS